MGNAGKSLAAVVAIVVVAGMGDLGAQDWPQWRGHSRDGKLSDFVAPQTWPKELTPKWKVTVGVGDSSPVLVGDRLYTFGRQEDNEVIRCIDTANGKVLWQEIYPAQFVVTGVSARHPGTRSTPAVDTTARGQSAAIVDAGSCLIALAVNGELSFYLPSDKQYTELACYKVGDPEI